MVVEQARWFQEQGGESRIAVADSESQATRGVSLAKGRTGLSRSTFRIMQPWASIQKNSTSTSNPRASSFSAWASSSASEPTSVNLKRFTGLVEKPTWRTSKPRLFKSVISYTHKSTNTAASDPSLCPSALTRTRISRLTRGLASKTNWFNLRESSSRGWLVSLSVHDENAEVFGQLPNGRVDKAKVAAVFDRVVEAVAALGFSDIMSSPKQGTVHIPSATSRDKHALRMALLRLERSLGGPGLMAPSSTYHHFAVGMTGDKMSSSQPKTTLFLRDDIATVEKKIKRAFSGGQPTVEEHRRLGGNPDIDVAYQYMMYFFEEDDAYLSEINAAFRAGTLLAGEMKQLCIERATAWMANLHEMRDQTAHQVSAFLAEDSR